MYLMCVKNNLMATFHAEELKKFAYNKLRWANIRNSFAKSKILHWLILDLGTSCLLEK